MIVSNLAVEILIPDYNALRIKNKGISNKDVLGVPSFIPILASRICLFAITNTESENFSLSFLFVLYFQFFHIFCLFNPQIKST